MTGQKEYTITEEQIQKLSWWIENMGLKPAEDCLAAIRSQPYDPEAIKAEERERVLNAVKEGINNYMLTDPKAKGHRSIHENLWRVIESLRMAGSMPAESGGLLK